LADEPSGASWWSDVTIRREPSGRPTVAVSDRLDRWRESRGLAVPGVSLTHAGGHAAALAWLPDTEPTSVEPTSVEPTGVELTRAGPT
jgi:phosphopantetheinyl transferase (holo-ACP synthase)